MIVRFLMAGRVYVKKKKLNRVYGSNIQSKVCLLKATLSSQRNRHVDTCVVMNYQSLFSHAFKRPFWTSYLQNVQHDNFHETHVTIKPCHFPEAG